jgi:hypothetical protein
MRSAGDGQSVKARIEGFEVSPDSFDYGPPGHTVAGMWSGDDAVMLAGCSAVVVSSCSSSAYSSASSPSEILSG